MTYNEQKYGDLTSMFIQAGFNQEEAEAIEILWDNNDYFGTDKWISGDDKDVVLDAVNGVYIVRATKGEDKKTYMVDWRGTRVEVQEDLADSLDLYKIKEAINTCDKLFKAEEEKREFIDSLLFRLSTNRLIKKAIVQAEDGNIYKYLRNDSKVTAGLDYKEGKLIKIDDVELYNALVEELK
ncbi:MAG: hypothetical protein ACOCRO_06440 [Halanaerobiales bacterium]